MYVRKYVKSFSLIQYILILTTTSQLLSQLAGGTQVELIKCCQVVTKLRLEPDWHTPKPKPCTVYCFSIYVLKVTSYCKKFDTKAPFYSLHLETVNTIVVFLLFYFLYVKFFNKD